MVTRKCGTCRFFRDAEIACSGWCTHPERGDLHDLVLVRRAELACRNSWDQDLWEASDRPLGRVPSAPVSSRVPPPAIALDDPTDRVTAIDIARPDASNESHSKHPAVAGGQGSRPATSQALTSKRGDRVHSGRSRGGVSSLEPSFSRALHGPSERRFARAEASDAQESTTVIASPSKWESQPPVPRIGSSMNAPRLESANDTSPLPVEELNLVIQREAGIRSQLAPANRYAAESIGAGSADPIIHVDGLNRDASRERSKFRSDSVLPAITTPQLSPLDESARVAGIPRCCDTCREFHRDATGKTGYCRSPYAFGSRTMVKSDQLACRSSIGVWWLPNDDTWLEKADISHHTRPTPYLDAILADVRPES